MNIIDEKRGFRISEQQRMALISNMADHPQLVKWVTELMNASKVTWSITRTIRTPPNKARKHTFKRIYQCHFNTDYRSPSGSPKKKHASRNIMCPAMLTIILVYITKNKSRSKTPDVLAEDWPCIIQFSGEHNHNIFSATTLIRRPIGESTKQEILEYFGRGHSVSSAYHSFCFKKMDEWGEEYNTLSADRHYFRNKTDFQNLWIKHFKHNYGERKGSEMFSKLKENLTNNKVSFKVCHIDDHYVNNVINTLTNENKTLFFKIATGSEPPKELFMSLKIPSKNLDQEESIVPATKQLRESEQSTSQENNNEIMDYNPTIREEAESSNDNILAIETTWTDFIKNLNEKVITGLKDDPLGFTRATQSCVTSYQKNINSSSSLLRSLHILFKSNDQRYTSKRLYTNTTRKGKKIGVQPTSVARRKTVITGRRKLQSGRQTGSLIKKKRKAVHSLSEYVEKNVSLGDNKFVK
ncbi:unnamed protein product [Psylliodes chrysocephalus]|uniref:Uncharacterized protein n=1 Tax=Psylliodes chrysocephalus TaxID=3402493 RepID=A0A9P0CZ44_9CUCU|nr:unnamed protein product [Psylliodes chrysocephala]